MNVEGSELVNQARKRLEEGTGLDLAPLFDACVAYSPDLQRTLSNLERWIGATSNPHIYLEHLLGNLELGRLLFMLLGSSQPVADSLVQNPELANIILDANELRRDLHRESVVSEGRRLVAAATSHSHALDRIRFLKQRWTLALTVNDLWELWNPEKVWRALSDLAEAIIQLAVESVWKQFAEERQLTYPCPAAVVVFGKLGGRELNYSSDIDLSYIVEDSATEFLDQHGQRFFERLTRALTDRMGRGMLYRVDLRLRPFGKSGHIANTMSGVEGYYKLYAEPWEIQALLKSRVSIGSEGLRLRWEQMREAHCFRPSLSERTFDDLLAGRRLTEEHFSEADFKRGRGGIRDVEFIAQILQLTYGYESPSIRSANTCDTLRALADTHRIDADEEKILVQSYTFLRQTEHRCQLVSDTQTHELPASREARESIAKSMHLEDATTLESNLMLNRRKIEALYQRFFPKLESETSARAAVLQKVGALAKPASRWFDSLPDKESFYEALESNNDSLSRVEKVLADAPKLIDVLQSSVSLTELILSGEVEEKIPYLEQLETLPLDMGLKSLADFFATAWTSTTVRWILSHDFDLGSSLSALADGLLEHCAKRLYAEFDLIALGSYARRELSISSDCDILLLIADSSKHGVAEQQGQDFLALIGKLKRLGAPIEIDLRLRPEGGQGLLVRTYDGLLAYELEVMEMWERFALGMARPIIDKTSSTELVTRIAYAQPLTPERLTELMGMKQRIEDERVLNKYRRRDVKLGYGGLSDIEWFVHIYEMRYPTALQVGANRTMPERIRALGRANLINAVECEELIEAHAYLIDMRHRLLLLGIEGSILPENPDRLDSLAHETGLNDGNALLMRHERTIETVRAIYQDGIGRLRT
jgi:[glutamine synthetase] adenylyltransferase / [glutamine synthetase]-adenylyl-L-tyrosine phosphorylase